MIFHDTLYTPLYTNFYSATPTLVPVNTLQPDITDHGDGTISCNTGIWTNDPASYSYQWQKNSVDIIGATSNSYDYTSNGIGTYTCKVTATNIHGSTTVNSNNAVITEWTPLNDSNLTGWFNSDNSANITESSNAVGNWTSEINGHNVAQIFASRKPDTNTRTLNTINVIDFDGNDTLVGDIAMPTSGNVSFFSVAQIDAVSATDDSLFALENKDSSGTNDFKFCANNASQFDGQFDGLGVTINLTGGAFVTEIFEIVCDFDSNSITAYTSGHERGSSNSYTTKIHTNIEVNLMKNKGASGHIDGGQGDLLISESVDTTTREKIEGYLAHKFGLTANLPAGHAYKTHIPFNVTV